MSHTEFRITSNLLEAIKTDLARSHAFAWERVGFIFCSAALSGKLLLATGYQSLSDDMYIPDDYVGARFSGTAIRQARQRALETGESVFHIHAHIGLGKPGFSRVDLESLAEMVPAFISVSPLSPHGAILLSDDGACGLVWRKGEKPKELNEVRVTGFHSKILNGGSVEQ